MDKATLVRSDLEAEGLVVEALGRAQIPVTLCDWNYVPELDEWQLVVATPWYDSKGPREANRLINEALLKAGAYKEIPIRRLFVRSPSDPVVKTLERELKSRTEGAIHILRHTPRGYSVSFTPYAGQGGPLPYLRFTDEEQLRDFLQERVRISAYILDDALSQLAAKGSSSIPRVQLSPKRARSLGLA
jgi:hypothetical protein